MFGKMNEFKRYISQIVKSCLRLKIFNERYIFNKLKSSQTHKNTLRNPQMIKTHERNARDKKTTSQQGLYRETKKIKGSHVAGKVRAAAVAVVDVAGRGVVESSVEVVARTLSVELTRAVGNVGLSSGQTEVKSLEELEHLVRIHNRDVWGDPN